MILTSTVKIKSKRYKLLPVKANSDIEASRLSEAMNIINKLQLVAPVTTGQILIEDFLEKGINLVATKTILE
ncbi:MAG: DUF1667 domain-containing protein [Clostridia bacterium]|nr:DUF1667 domain-containing protein [Clostridia bacterium]